MVKKKKQELKVPNALSIGFWPGIKNDCVWGVGWGVVLLAFTHSLKFKMQIRRPSA